LSEEIRRFLDTMPHFQKLPEAVRAQLASGARMQTFTQDTLLAEQGLTEIQHVYLVRSGLISIYNRTADGAELGGFIKPNEVFGGISMLMNGGISLRTVRVDAGTEACLIPKELFLNICQRYQDFYDYFVENYSRHVFDPAIAAFIASGQAKIFLGQLAPFSFLPEEVLDRVANHLSVVSHPRGTVLFRQGTTRIAYLYILQKGTAERYYESQGRKTMHDILSEGDMYGGISILLNDGLSVRTLELTEESRFYILPRQVFLQLCHDFQEFSEFFTDTFGKRMMNRSYAAIIARSRVPTEESLQLFHQSMTNLYDIAPVFGSPEMTIQEAAVAMRRHKSSYLLIPASKHHSAGILTDSDLAYKVIASGYDIQRRAVEIMSSPLRTISHQAMIFEALISMMEHGIKHLAVTDADGRIIGMFSHRELISAQGQSPLFILRKIADAQAINEVVEHLERMPGLVKHLIGNGAEAPHINRLITTVSDTVLQKVLGFVLQEMGTPPCAFAFMVMGSEGRGEQTLKTDQDNAIVFEDVDENETERIQAFFLELGAKTCAMLDQAGYSFCKAEVMARNPQLCRTLSVWKSLFSQWIHAAGREDLLHASIFFDFRFAFGERRLVDALRAHLNQAIGNWSGFLRHMTENALHFKPPLGFFRNFVVESKGEHRNVLDIKTAMMPIVDFARIYALKHSIDATHTLERLHRLMLQQVLSREEYDELEKAYGFLMQLRFMRQVAAVVDHKEPPDNYINPKKLTRLEQIMLKEIFVRIEKFQSKMNFDFIGIA
jgi:CBS domain-containing protein